MRNQLLSDEFLQTFHGCPTLTDVFLDGRNEILAHCHVVVCVSEFVVCDIR